MFLHRRVASKKVARKQSLERAIAPVFEGLEDRQMLAVQQLAGSILITGNGFDATTGRPVAQAFEFLTNDDVPVRISVAGDARVEVLFATNPDPGGGGQPTTISWGRPLPPDVDDDPPLPVGDIYAMYVHDGDLDSYITVAEFDPDNPNTVLPFEGNTDVRMYNQGNRNQPFNTAWATDANTGQILLGTRTLDTNPANEMEQDRPIASAILTNSFGNLDSGDVVNAGLVVADGVNLGRFLFGGTVTGIVDIGGSMEFFYAGNLLTGAAQGETALTTTVVDNFRVAGDLRNLLVAGSVGTLLSGQGGRLPQPSLTSGFDLNVEGKLGHFFAGGNLYGIGTIENSTNNSITRIQQEVESRGMGQILNPNGLTFSQVSFNWANGFPNNPVFNNDDLNSAQYLGDVNGEIHLNGNLIANPQNTDPIDVYGVGLMAGQTVEFQLDSATLLTPGVIQTLGTNFNILNIGVVDPDGRVVASDYTDVDSVNAGGIRFRFTADRPGVYKFVVVTPGNSTFSAGGISVFTGPVPYNLHIYNVGGIGVGGIAADGNLLDSDTSGVIFIDPDTGLPPDPTDPNNPPPGTANLNVGWQLNNGDWGTYRTNSTMVSNAGLALTTLTKPTATVRVLDGNLRSIAGNSLGTLNGTVSSSTPEIDVPNGSVGEIRSNGLLGINAQTISLNPAFGLATTSLLYNFVGGDIQRVIAGGRFYGSLVANKGIGNIEANNMATLSPSIITANADRIGNDGNIDMIDIRGDLGTLAAGGPWITTGPRGNVRYLNAEGAVFSDLFFGGGAATTTVYPAGEGDVFRDDSGVKFQVNPTGGGVLQALTYGIRGSGGVAMVRLTSSSGMDVESLGRTAKGTLEIGKIISTSATPTTIGLGGKKRVDVLYITGNTFSNITNETAGELVTVRATNLDNIEAQTLGFPRRSFTKSAVLPGDIVSNTYPFDNARWGIVASNSIGEVRARGAVGNVLLTGGTVLDTVTANSDNKTSKKQFDGIVGAIFSQGNVNTVNLGQGMAAAGNGQAGVTGVYAIGTIDEVIGENNADIRGNIVSQVRINNIRLRGGSIINSNIMVIGTLASAREFTGTITTPDDGDEFTDPSYEIGQVLIQGGGGSSRGRGSRGKSKTAQGGIIGSLFIAADIGVIRVQKGFGLLNSTIAAQFDARVDIIEADGLGIRDVFINSSALLRELTAVGKGNRIKSTNFSPSVRRSEGKAFDPFFQFRHNRLTDLHTFLGTTKQKPTNGDASRSGIIAGLDARGGRRLDTVTAFEVRGSFLGVDSIDLLGNPIRIPYFPTVFNYANEIEEFVTKRDVRDVAITTGRIGFMNVGRDINGTSTFTVAGVIEDLRVRRDVGPLSTIRAVGPDGDIEDLLIGRNLNGTIIAEQDILKARVRGQVNGTLADKDGPVTPRR